MIGAKAVRVQTWLADGFGASRWCFALALGSGVIGCRIAKPGLRPDNGNPLLRGVGTRVLNEPLGRRLNAAILPAGLTAPESDFS